MIAAMNRAAPQASHGLVGVFAGTPETGGAGDAGAIMPDEGTAVVVGELI